MKKPDKNKMGRIGKMLVLGTALLSMATPMAAFAKTDRVDTPGTWREHRKRAGWCIRTTGIIKVL